MLAYSRGLLLEGLHIGVSSFRDTKQKELKQILRKMKQKKDLHKKKMKKNKTRIKKFEKE